jgi:hypothetical protein
VTHGAESTARARRYEQRPEAVDGLPKRENVFRDLGFSGDEAKYVKVRAELIVNLQSDLMRGRIDLSASTHSSTCTCSFRRNRAKKYRAWAPAPFDGFDLPI